MKRGYILCFLTACMICTANGQQVMEAELDTGKTGHAIRPTMWGLFFEDLNFAADGGIYAEMVKNRSFEFPQNLMGWKAAGNFEVRRDDAPFVNNPNYMVLAKPPHPQKMTFIENEGFFGMAFSSDSEYRFSVWARKSGVSPQPEALIEVQLIGAYGDILSSGKIRVESDKWQKYEIRIVSPVTEKNGRLRIVLLSETPVAMDHVSLFPADTWKGRENGLRSDLMGALADLKPGVFRFPGGCIVEGTDLETRYNWKKSVGPVEDRPLNENRWQHTFPQRLFPDYYQSYGLGFYEYFLMAEDLGAEPVPVVSCGLACQFQNDDLGCHASPHEMEDYIRDALDLIEFANGPVTSQWGKVRAEMGHPEPFGLKFLGIGNEQWGEEYVERLELFVDRIGREHPEIILVGSSGPFPDGAEFDYLWPEMNRLGLPLVDEHYYKDPDWFLRSATRYDGYPRSGAAVFAGEYACHTPGRENSLWAALCEAAFMTGLERNADLVQMCTYAPLFARLDGWQWKPDMIWFDNTGVILTPNYHVQRMFSSTKGTHSAGLTIGGAPVTGQNGIYASAVYDAETNCYHIKTVNVGDNTVKFKLRIPGEGKNTNLRVTESTILHNTDPQAVNSMDDSVNVAPKNGTAARAEGEYLLLDLPGFSLTVTSVRLDR